MSFEDQLALGRVLPEIQTWIDVGHHDSVGWVLRKTAALAHRDCCGPRCIGYCGGTRELAGMAGMISFAQGDLIAPPNNGVFTLSQVLMLAAFGVGSSCGSIVIDDLGAILDQRPTRDWWINFAMAADASTQDGVPIYLLAKSRDLARWPDGLQQPAWFRQGVAWWIGKQFGTRLEFAP